MCVCVCERERVREENLELILSQRNSLCLPQSTVEPHLPGPDQIYEMAGYVKQWIFNRDNRQFYLMHSKMRLVLGILVSISPHYPFSPRQVDMNFTTCYARAHLLEGKSLAYLCLAEPEGPAVAKLSASVRSEKPLYTAPG